MNRVLPRPQLTEDWKFNNSFHILIFIWQRVLSAGAHAPRQGFCPRPCTCHSPSGPPHLSASASIPIFCPAPSPQPTVGLFCPTPSQIPSCLAPLCLDFQETFQTLAGQLPAWRCFSWSPIRLHHWDAFNFAVVTAEILCLLPECPSHYWLRVAVEMGTHSIVKNAKCDEREGSDSAWSSKHVPVMKNANPAEMSYYLNCFSQRKPPASAEALQPFSLITRLT